MSNLQKSKTLDLVDTVNDISRYLDDIFTIDNPELEKKTRISNLIYLEYPLVLSRFCLNPVELQLNKANSDKKKPFSKKNITVIGDDIHTSFYDKRDDFGFSIVNFPWLNGDVPRLPSYGIYISQLILFAKCCTRVVDFHYKIQIASGLQISQAS